MTTGQHGSGSVDHAICLELEDEKHAHRLYANFHVPADNAFQQQMLTNGNVWQITEPWVIQELADRQERIGLDPRQRLVCVL